MADQSPIEWTNATWNPVRGCTRKSPGCGGPKHEGGCYAEKIAARFSDPGQPFHGFARRNKHGGSWTGKLALIDDMLTVPLRWRKPRRIFVNSMSDLFHENLSDEAIDKVFAVMALCPEHTFQVLTKRSARMRAYVTALIERMRKATESQAAEMILGIEMGRAHTVASMRAAHLALCNTLHNVWLGISAEDQPRYDERWPNLRETPAAVRFISYEPALGPLSVASHEGRPNWIISGGESGPRSRPAHPDWFRAIRDECAADGIAYFHKQNGDWAPGECGGEPPTRSEDVAYYDEEHGWTFDKLTARVSQETHRDDEPDVYRFGKKRAGATLDGVMHREFPT